MGDWVVVVIEGLQRLGVVVFNALHEPRIAFTEFLIYVTLPVKITMILQSKYRVILIAFGAKYAKNTLK